MRLNHEMDKLAVCGSDGFVNLVNADSLKPIQGAKKMHNMVVTGAAFYRDTTLVTASTDYSYMFTPLSDFSLIRWLTKLLTQFGVLFIILLLVADYLY